MQRFLRNKVPPSIFREEQFRKSREQLLDFFSLGTQERSQTRLPMEDLELNLNQLNPVYDALGQMFDGNAHFAKARIIHFPTDFDQRRPQPLRWGGLTRISTMSGSPMPGKISIPSV